MIRVRFFWFIATLTCFMACAANAVAEPVDSILTVAPDSIEVKRGLNLPSINEIKSIQKDKSLNSGQKMKAFGNFIVRVIDAFDEIDSSYVERIPYTYTAMLQATTNLEFYSLRSSETDERITFAQRPDLRFGPYFGWRWLFLGTTFDISPWNRKKSSSSRFEFSIYTSMIGIDLIYRKTGSDFYISSISGLGDDAQKVKGTDCDYIRTDIKGVNLYYVLNHKRFSLPAVFSQSTLQRRSAGSLLFGASVTGHNIKFDYQALPSELLEETENDHIFKALERAKYIDYSLSCGYAYNWVPARNWCVGVSVTPAIGYKHFTTETALLTDSIAPATTSPFLSKMDEILSRRGNVNIDVTGRLGVIYNNGKWFMGAFGVIHNYNYRRGSIRFSNTFGTANLCVGFFFQRKRSIKGVKNQVRM